EKRLELRLARASDVTFVVSDAEKEIVERELPRSKVLVVSNIHCPSAGPVRIEGRDAVCFIGNFEHPPNVDAARFFVEAILPRVRVEIPGMPVFLIGSDPPRSLLELGTNGVVITGHVRDLGALLARCRTSVAPLRFGAGVKGT